MSFFGLWAFQDRPPSICVSLLKPVFLSSVDLFHRYFCIFHWYFSISVVFQSVVWPQHLAAISSKTTKRDDLVRFGQAEGGKVSRQKSLIRTKLILDCLTILQNICEVVTVKTVEIKISWSQRIWPAPVILIELEKICHFTGADSKFEHVWKSPWQSWMAGLFSSQEHTCNFYIIFF